MAGKLLITGAAGQLGQALVQTGAWQGWTPDQLLGPGLEHQAIGLALARHDVGVGGAQDDVDRVGVGREDGGQRVDDVLDALVRREQTEREDHRLALDAEPDGDLGRGHSIRGL